MLNTYFKEENEEIKIQNEILRNQDDNMLFNLYHWYKKSKKIKANDRVLRNKVRGLQRKILMGKPI